MDALTDDAMHNTNFLAERMRVRDWQRRMVRSKEPLMMMMRERTALGRHVDHLVIVDCGSRDEENEVLRVVCPTTLS
jgi:hypothetical protein